MYGSNARTIHGAPVRSRKSVQVNDTILDNQERYSTGRIDDQPESDRNTVILHIKPIPVYAAGGQESRGVPLWLKAAGAMGIAPLVEHDLRSGRLIRPFEVKLSNAFSFWFVCQRKRAGDPVIRKFRN